MKCSGSQNCSSEKNIQEIEKFAIGFVSKLSKILFQSVQIEEGRTIYEPESKNLRGSGFPPASPTVRQVHNDAV